MQEPIAILPESGYNHMVRAEEKISISTCPFTRAQMDGVFNSSYLTCVIIHRGWVRDNKNQYPFGQTIVVYSKWINVCRVYMR